MRPEDKLLAILLMATVAVALSGGQQATKRATNSLIGSMAIRGSAGIRVTH